MNEGMNSKINIVFLVGGFSECELVQERLRHYFGNDRVTIPFDASKVQYFFYHRRAGSLDIPMEYKYGQNSIRPLNRKEIVDREERCQNLFLKFVSKGDPIEPGIRKSYIFKPLERGKNHLKVDVYFSYQKDPKYVDETGCA